MLKQLSWRVPRVCTVRVSVDLNLSTPFRDRNISLEIPSHRGSYHRCFCFRTRTSVWKTTRRSYNTYVCTDIYFYFSFLRPTKIIYYLIDISRRFSTSRRTVHDCFSRYDSRPVRPEPNATRRPVSVSVGDETLIHRNQGLEPYQIESILEPKLFQIGTRNLTETLI